MHLLLMGKVRMAWVAVSLDVENEKSRTHALLTKKISNLCFQHGSNFTVWFELEFLRQRGLTIKGSTPVKAHGT